MGILDSFEKGLERAVNGAFAKTFRGGTPARRDHLRAAPRARQEGRRRRADRILAPNRFVVRLSPSDDQTMTALGDALDRRADTLCSSTRRRRATLRRPVIVASSRDDQPHDGHAARSTRRPRRARSPGAGARHRRPAAPARQIAHRDRPRQRRRHHRRGHRHQPQARRDPVGRRAREVRDLGSTNGTTSTANGAAASPESRHHRRTTSSSGCRAGRRRSRRCPLTTRLVAHDAAERVRDERAHAAACCGSGSSLLLWFFVFAVVYALRSDLFGGRVRSCRSAGPRRRGARPPPAARRPGRLPTAPVAAAAPASRRGASAAGDRRRPPRASSSRRAQGRARAPARQRAAHHRPLERIRPRDPRRLHLHPPRATAAVGRRVDDPGPRLHERHLRSTASASPSRRRCRSAPRSRSARRRSSCGSSGRDHRLRQGAAPSRMSARCAPTTRTPAMPGRTCSSSPTAWAATRAATSPPPSPSNRIAQADRASTSRPRRRSSRCRRRVDRAPTELIDDRVRAPRAHRHGHDRERADAGRRHGRDRAHRRLAHLPAPRRRAHARSPTTTPSCSDSSTAAASRAEEAAVHPRRCVLMRVLGDVDQSPRSTPSILDDRAGRPLAALLRRPLSYVVEERDRSAVLADADPPQAAERSIKQSLDARRPRQRHRDRRRHRPHAATRAAAPAIVGAAAEPLEFGTERRSRPHARLPVAAAAPAAHPAAEAHFEPRLRGLPRRAHRGGPAPRRRRRADLAGRRHRGCSSPPSQSACSPATSGRRRATSSASTGDQVAIYQGVQQTSGRSRSRTSYEDTDLRRWSSPGYARRQVEQTISADSLAGRAQRS